MDICIKHLYKKFDNNIVLNGINCIFKSSEINCIIGNSGCGKTTLINIIMNIIHKDSGEILGLENQTISAVFQEDRLCETLDCMKNIRLVCNKNISNSEIKKHLNSVGLNDLNKPVYKLSGGMKRRLAIVRAVIYNSNILIMDEPFKGLDENTKLKVINYIKLNTKQRTLIIVTHDKTEIKLLNIKDTNLISL